MNRWLHTPALAGLLLGLALLQAGAAPLSELKKDQQLLFFPALAWQAPDKSWELEVRGCIFELEQRRFTLALMRQVLQLKHVRLSPSQEGFFAERARLFMVDHKGGKRVVIRIGQQTCVLNKSHADGQFSGMVRLSQAEAQELQAKGSAFRAVLAADDPRQFLGQVQLLQPRGLTIISDIDDTIKLTQVTERKAMLRRTFLEPFEPVAGMAQLYQAWARDAQAQFCYVSASPWQLWTPLAAFVVSNHFPNGLFALKQVRWKDKSLLNLFESPARFKPSVIEPLLERFPNRRFVLVGDSGESDPELYTALAQRHPEQIVAIFIRDTTGQPATAERCRKLFSGLPPGLARLFRQPEEIAHLPLEH